MSDDPNRSTTIPTCRDMSEIASDYLDGSLPWRKRLAAWYHLYLCEACRNYFDQFQRTIGFLRRAPAAEPDTETEDRILAAMEKNRPET